MPVILDESGAALLNEAETPALAPPHAPAQPAGLHRHARLRQRPISSRTEVLSLRPARSAAGARSIRLPILRRPAGNGRGGLERLGAGLHRRDPGGSRLAGLAELDGRQVVRAASVLVPEGERHRLCANPRTVRDHAG
jgi:hypothetical protein